MPAKANHESDLVRSPQPSTMPSADAPWTQSNKELTLLIPVGADVRAKEVQVRLTSQVRAERGRWAPGPHAVTLPVVPGPVPQGDVPRR